MYVKPLGQYLIHNKCSKGKKKGGWTTTRKARAIDHWLNRVRTMKQEFLMVSDLPNMMHLTNQDSRIAAIKGPSSSFTYSCYKWGNEGSHWGWELLKIIQVVHSLGLCPMAPYYALQFSSLVLLPPCSVYLSGKRETHQNGRQNIGSGLGSEVLGSFNPQPSEK